MNLKDDFQKHQASLVSEILTNQKTSVFPIVEDAEKIMDAAMTSHRWSKHRDRITPIIEVQISSIKALSSLAHELSISVREVDHGFFVAERKYNGGIIRFRAK